MRRIAVLTSGGDAPGMNPAVRAVARTAFARRWEVVGIEAGYRGLMEGRFGPLGNRTVGTAAVEALAEGESGVMIGLRGRQMERIPLVEASIYADRPLISVPVGFTEGGVPEG